MALLGTFIDQRTFAAGLLQFSTTTFAHGLGASPDIVLFEFLGSTASTAQAGQPLIARTVDATNVTITNSGSILPAYQVTSIRFHSIIR